MKKAVIIVAGGSGLRMNSEVPKQFIEWCGKPILMHTIERFYSYDNTIDIILVLPQNQFDLWNQLCLKYSFTIKLSLTNGGDTRFESVKNGLKTITKECLVGIHDGVRPLVSCETLNSCYSLAEKNGSAIPVTSAIESIREIKANKSVAVNRENFKMVQTPQVFICSKLKVAYSQSYNKLFTDDASVFEHAGFSINLTHGNRENIKITTPIDLIISTALKKFDDEND